jgi:putative membrane protein
MVRNIIFICLVGVVVIFVLQNTQVVEVRFLFWTISMSRALMLFGTLAIGLVGGWLVTLPNRRKGIGCADFSSLIFRFSLALNGFFSSFFNSFWRLLVRGFFFRFILADFFFQFAIFLL